MQSGIGPGSRQEKTMGHHYYATTVYGWATAPTKEKALAKLVTYVGDSIWKSAKRSEHKGMPVHVVRVDLPEKAHYSISGYLPNTITKEDGVNEARKGERVPMGEVERVIVTTKSGKHVSAPTED